jgi:hypothetical protein
MATPPLAAEFRMNDEGKSSPDVTKNSNTSEEKGNKAKQFDK